MISAWLVVAVLFAHWVADFVLQKHAWSIAKSKSNVALGKHVATYTAALGVFGVVVSGGMIGVIWAGYNGVMHFVIDYFTSRMTSKLYADNRVHDFFVVIGFDQWLHVAILVLTAMAWL